MHREQAELELLVDDREHVDDEHDRRDGPDHGVVAGHVGPGRAHQPEGPDRDHDHRAEDGERAEARVVADADDTAAQDEERGERREDRRCERLHDRRRQHCAERTGEDGAELPSGRDADEEEEDSGHHALAPRGGGVLDDRARLRRQSPVHAFGIEDR